MNTPVGFIVSWSVPQSVNVDLLRASLTAAGLALDLAPDLKLPQVCARTAGFIAKSSSDKSHRRLARPITFSSRQITSEETTVDRLTYTREAAIKVDDATQTIVSDDPAISRLLPEITRTINETRTASDVTRIVQKVVEDAGADLIPVREQGGAYFIPNGHGIMGKITALVQGIGGDVSQFACTLGHGSDESVANTITDYLFKQIDELKASVVSLGEKGIRSDVKSRRLNDVAVLRDRIRSYSTLIQAHGTKLETALMHAEEMLLAKLGPSAPEAAPAEEAPPEELAGAGASVDG